MLKNILAKTIAKHGFSQKKIESLIETPPSKELGDFSLPCFALAKDKNPSTLASTLKKELVNNKAFEKIETKGPYLNFFFKNSYVAQKVLPHINNDFKTKNKLVCIESPSPNTNKPLHVGHARNISIGRSLVKIYEKLGWQTFKTEIVNDRGIHICKSMVAYDIWGYDETPTSTGLKPDHFVGKYYTLFNEKAKDNPKLEEKAKAMLRKWETKDDKVRSLWNKMNTWCLKGLKQTYDTYGMKLDKQYFESEIYELGRKKVMEGAKKGVFTKQEKGIIVNLEKHDLGKKILLRSDGTSLYITQDIALAYLRDEDVNMDKMLYVVGQEQKYHFKVLFNVLDLLGFNYSEKAKHIGYGFVSLPSGKMSSREGNVVLADELVDNVQYALKQEYKERNFDISNKEIERRSEVLAMATIKFELLKVDTYKDIVFDIQESVEFKGDTAPYILYTYARLKSILSNVAKVDDVDYSLLQQDIEKELILALNNFRNVIKNSYNKENPSLIINYVLPLTRKINKYYQDVQILVDNKNVKISRCALVKQCAVTLREALNLLDISVLEEM